MRRAYGNLAQLSGGMTRGVRFLLVSCVVVFIIQTILDRALAPVIVDGYHTIGWFSYIFGLSAGGVSHGYIWQPFTYMFLHGNALHIVLNMLVLFFLGPETERTVGTRQFYILYFLSGGLAGLGWVLINPSLNVCVGASGAIFGILGAFAALYPNRPLTLLVFFVLPVTMKAWVLVLGLVLVELLFLVGQPGGIVAHSVHLAGAVAGYVYTYIVFRQGRKMPQISWFRRAPRLTVVPGAPPSVGPSQAEVDRVLEKIASQGVNSLTARERAILENASHNLRSR